VRQVTAPVRWEASIERIAAMGITQALEVGAGRVLAGLVKRIAPAIEVRAASDPTMIAEIVAELKAAGTAPASLRAGDAGKSELTRG